MQFLIDEDLPRSTGELVRRYGHTAVDVRDVGLRGAKDSRIASYAQENGLCLLTGDFDFSDMRNYPPSQYMGIVILKVSNMATAGFILHILEELLKQETLVAKIPGSLLIVEPGRIRVRR